VAHDIHVDAKLAEAPSYEHGPLSPNGDLAKNRQGEISA
jgi:hypothetical protein